MTSSSYGKGEWFVSLIGNLLRNWRIDMTEPYEGYTCWRLKDGQSCDYCPEYSNCPANNDDN